MKARLEKGGWTFPPPLGYRPSRDRAGKKTFVPDPERSQFITHAFEIYASGLYNKNQVLDIVTKMGLRTKAGKIMRPQSFGQLLRKPIYAGRMIVRGWNISTAAEFPTLVSPNIFDQVQALLEGRRPSVGPRLRSNPEFPLRHFVRCGRCERRSASHSWGCSSAWR